MLRHDLSAVLARDAETPSFQPAVACDGFLGTNLAVQDAAEHTDGFLHTVSAAGPPKHCYFLFVVVDLLICLDCDQSFLRLHER